MIDGYIVTDGGLVRIARIRDEVWQESEFTDPAPAIESLKRSRTKADLFTFAQSLPETKLQHGYFSEIDNLAVADTTDYDRWWTALPQAVRKNVRRSERRGVVIRRVRFDQQLVQSIKKIYDEGPTRQGRRFPHYLKDLEAVGKQNSSYLDRSEFLGAFVGDELIGFLKMVFVRETARIMQILCLNSEEDKRPTTALLAAAVALCHERGKLSLIYGQFIYDGNATSSLTEFKRRHGFVQVCLPRYYIPLNLKGRLALALKLHRGLKTMIPQPISTRLRRARARRYAHAEALTSARREENHKISAGVAQR